jgi:hypothetical protein
VVENNFGGDYIQTTTCVSLRISTSPIGENFAASRLLIGQEHRIRVKSSVEICDSSTVYAV